MKLGDGTVAMVGHIPQDKSPLEAALEQIEDLVKENVALRSQLENCTCQGETDEP